MTDFKTHFDAIRDAIHDDATTQAWCAAEYGSTHKVYVGIDERDPPAEGDCPLVHVFPMGQINGMDLEQKDRSFGVVCVLHDDAASVQARGNIVEKKSIGNLLTFTKYVVAAIDGVDIDDWEIGVADVEFDTIESFPFILSSVEVRLTRPYYQGESDYFE